jgi:hypothetical protein
MDWNRDENGAMRAAEVVVTASDADLLPTGQDQSPEKGPATYAR